jgi:hypothetical protein
LGAVCAVAGLCLTIFAEWTAAPFVADESLQFFLTHLHKLNNFSVKAMITAVGVALAYWLGQGR